MSAPQFVSHKGRLRVNGESSQPLHCFGMVVAQLSCSHLEGTIALEVADTPDGPWGAPRDGNGAATTREPRTLAFCTPDAVPFYARVKAVDLRSWARPVHFELRSIAPPAPEPDLPDPRAPIRTGADADHPEETAA